MSDVQKQVQEAIGKIVESGTERGLQVAVYRHGEQVVDAVAGVTDHETGRPVASGTPFYCYSVGKGATATVAHVLVERGLFGYDTPIVELWPEGKPARRALAGAGYSRLELFGRLQEVHD